MDNAKSKKSKRHTEPKRQRVIELRRAGKTHREIERETGICLSLAVAWTRGIILTDQQKTDIQRRKSAKIYTPERRAEISKAMRSYLAAYPRLKYSEEDLIKKIQHFYKANGRMPLKREFNTYRAYKRRFGSWNAAIRKAGFKPNPELFAHKFVAKDSHRCDSFTEKIIDDWLFRRRISHERHKKYPGAKRMTADFYIEPNVLIEFFGLAGEQKEYDIIMKKKRALAKKGKLQLIEIFPADIYPRNRLAQILNFI